MPPRRKALASAAARSTSKAKSKRRHQADPTPLELESEPVPQPLLSSDLDEDIDDVESHHQSQGTQTPPTDVTLGRSVPEPREDSLSQEIDASQPPDAGMMWQLYHQLVEQQASLLKMQSELQDALKKIAHLIQASPDKGSVKSLRSDRASETSPAPSTRSSLSDKSSSSRPPRDLPTLPRYGGNRDFDLYLTVNLPKLSHLPDDLKQRCMNDALPDSILKYIVNQPVRSFDDYLECLRKYLVPTATPYSLMRELSNRRQHPDESVRQYLSELRCLARKAFPEVDMEELQKDKINDLLIYGLRDKMAQAALMATPPKSLEELLKVVDRFEVLRQTKSEIGQESEAVKKSHESTDKSKRNKKRKRPESDDKASTSGRADGKGQNSRRSPQKESRPPAEDHSRPRGVQSNNPLICYGCGEPGHTRNRCPRAQHQPRTPYQSGPRFSSAPSAGNQVFYSSQPNPTYSFHAGRVPNPQGSQPQSGTNVSSSSGDWRSKNPNRMCNMTADRSEVCIRIRDQPVTCVLDTGAGVNFIKWELVKKLKLPFCVLRRPRAATMADGKPLEVTKIAWVDIWLGSHRVHVQFYVVPTLGLDNALLGLDFIKNTQGVIHLPNRRYYAFQDVSLPLGDGRPHYENVLCCRRTHLAPRSETTVPIEMVGLAPDPKAVLVEGNEQLPKGLFVQQTLVRSDKPPCVKVLNVNDKPMFLDEGTPLGNAEPVDSCEYHVEKHADNLDPFEGLEIELEEMVHLEHLQPALRARMLQLLQKYRHVFLCKGESLGRTDKYTINIETGNAKPVKVPPRRMAPAHKAIVEQELGKMLAENVIEPSASPWSSPIVLVKKKNGETRFCVDYRAVNSVIEGDSYPLPRIDETLESLEGNGWFSTLDLKSGYWQVPLDQNDKLKTAFSCHKGLFHFNVCPFGLKTAPSKFMRMMDIILSGLKPEKCLVYLDDTIIVGRTFEEHLMNLEEVLQRFEASKLKLNPDKCRWALQEVAYLGHIVSKDGIRTDPSKVEAVKNWAPPRSLKELRSFLGLTGYYRKFIPGYSKVAKPLTNLTKKDAAWLWGELEQTAFDGLKNALCSDPILQFPSPDPRHKFRVETDASDSAIGAVLSQEDETGKVTRVICYGSKALSTAERNYCTTRKELLAIVHFVHEWRAYLYQRKFTIYTDHAALKWLNSLKEPLGQLSRWAGQLTTYSFDIVHRKGTSNANADALSRKHPHWTTCPSCAVKQIGQVSVVNIEGTLYNQIKAAQRDDADLAWVLAKKSRNEVPKLNHDMSRERRVLVNAWEDIQVNDGVAYIISRYVDRPQLLVPKKWRNEALTNHHDVLHAGHLGINKTYRRLQEHFYWPDMRKHVIQWCHSCSKCQELKGKPGRVPLIPIKTTYFNEMVCSDVIGPWPISQKGNSYVITFIDHFTRWIEAIPVANHTAETLAKAFVQNWIVRYGVPSRFLSDQGPEYESELMKELTHVFNIKKLRTTPLHPQTNGMSERVQRTFKNMLATSIDEGSQTNWDDCLDMVLYAYRSSFNESTGYSPYEMLFGELMPLPLERSIGATLPARDTVEEYVQEKGCDRFRIMSKVWENAEKARSQYKANYDKAVTKQSAQFKKGDRVWLFEPNLRLGENAKLKKNWSGPWLVLDHTSGVNVRIKPLTGKHRKIITVHVNRLKLCQENTRFPKTNRGRGVNNRVEKRPEVEFIDPDDIEVAAIEEVW